MFRYPTNYISITQGYHKGKSLDFGWCNHHGQNIYSCGDGVVYRIETQTTGGKTIFIKHTNGNISCYGHLGSISVKKGQSVKLGQKIGTMGATGICTAEHLHFGIYSSEKKNIYGNADVDPFNVCYVYSDQDNSKVNSAYKNKMKTYVDNWTIGGYQLLVSKALRTSHNLGLNTVKVKNCDLFTKKYLTSNKPNDTAMIRTGKPGYTIRSIYKESNGRIWGYWYKYWIVLCNVDGTPQAKKVD